MGSDFRSLMGWGITRVLRGSMLKDVSSWICAQRTPILDVRLSEAYEGNRRHVRNSRAPMHTTSPT
jgi:hypothetical protein